MTAVSPIVGTTIRNEPAYVDIRAWRGDDLILPFTFFDDSKAVNDGVTTLESGVLVSASAPWVSGDVGSAIVGDKIPFGSTIGTFTDASHVTLAASVEATGSKEQASFRWGPALDLSTDTFQAQVRPHADSTVVKATFTMGTADAADGLLTATIATTAMAALAIGRYYWDLQRTVAGAKRTLLAGAFIVLGDVTR